MSFGVFLCARPLGFIGFPSSHLPSSFPTGIRGLFSSDTVRDLVAQAVSSTHRLAASLKCFHSGLRTEHRRHSSRFDSGAPSLGFAFPYHDISKPYRCCPGPSSSRCLPSVTFLPPPTVYATTYLASLFHPAAASRIHSSRDFPPTQPRRLVDAALPSCRFSRARCTQFPMCSTDSVADFRALLHARVRCQDDGV